MIKGTEIKKQKILSPRFPSLLDTFTCSFNLNNVNILQMKTNLCLNWSYIAYLCKAFLKSATLICFASFTIVKTQQNITDLVYFQHLTHQEPHAFSHNVSIMKNPDFIQVGKTAYYLWNTYLDSYINASQCSVTFVCTIIF